MELDAFRKSLDDWLDEHDAELAPSYDGAGTLDQRMAQIAKVRRLAFDAGWARWGWPEQVGGFGGSTLLRAYLSEAVTARDLVEAGLYSMPEVLGPSVITFARPELSAADAAAAAAGRPGLVPGVLRAGHGQQPGLARLPRRPHRRRLAGDRPEGVDQPVPVRPAVRPADADRLRRIGAQGHHRPVRRHGHPRHHDPAHRDHRRRAGVRRGVLRRRARPLRPHDRRGGPGLGVRHGPAPLRAQHGPLAAGRRGCTAGCAISSTPPSPVPSTPLPSAR